jgi:putative ABC transport system permease protein
MFRALARKALADLRGQRLQGVAIFLIVAAATATLVLGLTLNRSSSNPWERAFAATNGAHVELFVRPEVDSAPVLHLDEVAEAAGPFPTLWDQRLIDELDKHEIGLYGLPAEPIAVARPQVTDGRWLTAGAEREIVLDRSTAREIGVATGETVAFLTPRGKVSLLVVGLAVSGNWGAYPDWTPGLGYVLPETLTLLEPDRSAWSTMLLVRLDEPAATRAFIDHADAVLPAGAVTGDVTWQEVRENLDFNNAIFVVLLSVFSVLALVAAGLVIANAIAGRVLAQSREIGLLKAIGVTPRGVALLFLAEHLALACAGGLLGVAVGLAVAPRLLSRAADVLDTTAAPTYDPVSLGLALAAVLLLVVLFTLLPAWRAGRIPTVRAITVGLGGTPKARSRLATLAARLRLPVVAVLGIKDAFARPLRAWVTVAALSLTVVCVVLALSVEATLQRLLDDPTMTGGALAMAVDRGDVPDATAQQILSARPEVLEVLTVAEIEGIAVVGGWPVEVATRAVGDNYAKFRLRVVEGRQFAAPGEAIAGQGLLDLLGVRVGDTVQLSVDGGTLTLRIVGRYLELDNDGRWLTYGFETLRAQLDPVPEPESYGLMLKPETDREALKAELVRASDDQFEVTVFDAADLDEDVRQFRIVLAGLAGALFLLGLGNLLTTALLGVRERMRDVGVLKAIGCTPRQVVASVVVGVGLLAVLGVAVGLPLGLAATRAMLDFVGAETGFGREFGAMPPWTWLAALAPIAVLIATLAGILPARRAAAVRVTEALRAE